MYLPLDSKDPNPYKYNSVVSFLHVWVRKEVNINILAPDVNRTILRLPVPVERGGFHLHLLVFPFIYQFHSRIEALVSSSFAND